MTKSSKYRDHRGIATLEEVFEASLRFPKMPVHEALELNRHLRTNVADAMRGE